MLKLYKLVNGVLRYHEAWISDGMLTTHYGIAGQTGDTFESKLPNTCDEDVAITNALKDPIAKGYAPIAIEDHAVLLVQYAVDGFGTPQDLDKRHALEDRINSTLGWSGLGHCDGGSIGSGTMEVCCYVVDFDLARRVIEADLAGTAFADYSRIFSEDSD